MNLQDFPKIVSQVVAVAMGPDGRPALLTADRPAGTKAEGFAYNESGQVTAIAFYSAFDTSTSTPSGLLATKNFIWNTSGNGAGQPAFTHWT